MAALPAAALPLPPHPPRKAPRSSFLPPDNSPPAALETQRHRGNTENSSADVADQLRGFSPPRHKDTKLIKSSAAARRRKALHQKHILSFLSVYLSPPV